MNERFNNRNNVSTKYLGKKMIFLRGKGEFEESLHAGLDKREEIFECFNVQLLRCNTPDYMRKFLNVSHQALHRLLRFMLKVTVVGHLLSQIWIMKFFHIGKLKEITTSSSPQ